MTRNQKLSIIIPVFNEENTVEELLKRVVKAKLGNWKREIIIVNDGSTDSSRSKIDNFIRKRKGNKITFVSHKKNRGKGVAIQTGLKHVTGDALIVQDSDLEYDPNDIAKLLKKLEEGDAKIIFGSRNIRVSKGEQKLYVWGINLSTKLTNLLYGTKLSDLYTCYKLYDRKCFENISVKSVGFEWDIEQIVKLLRRGFQIDEVPIKYNPRKISEGKKIRVWDGIIGIWIILKYRLL